MHMNSLRPIPCSQRNPQNEEKIVDGENPNARHPSINSIAPQAISSNLRRKRDEEEKILDDNPPHKRRRIAQHNIHNNLQVIHYQEVPVNFRNANLPQNMQPDGMDIDNAPAGNPNLKRKRPEEENLNPAPIRRRRFNDANPEQKPVQIHRPSSRRHIPPTSSSSQSKSSRSSSPPAIERDPFLRDRLSLKDRASKVSPSQSRDFDQKFTIDGKNIDFKHPTSKVSALFIYPRNDHNNAFRLNDHLKYRLLALSEHYNVKVRYVHDIDEAGELISNSKYAEIHHLVLGGHGSASSITFGHGGGRASLTTETKVDPTLFEKLAPKATILLDSCSAGLRLAEYVARLAPGRYVYGSEVTLYSSMILIDSIFPYRCTISEHGRDRTAITVC